MKISIITPSYNQCQYLEQTIDSILSQGYTDLEYLIIDGGSEDGSVDIIKRYEKFLTYWVSEPDKGQSDAINKGLRRVTGDVVQWINSDDWLEPDSLQKISEAFENPEIDVVCGKSRLLYENGETRISPGTDIYMGNLARTLGQARIDQPETWFRGRVFHEITPVRKDLHYVMDKQLWMHYLLKYGLHQIHQIDDLLVNFRIHSQSKTGSKSEEFFEETIKLFLSLFKQGSLANMSDQIEKITGVSLDNNYFEGIGYSDELIRDSAAYTLLNWADEYYCKFDYRKASALIDLVKFEKLDETESQRYLKLRKHINWRLNYFRQWISV